MSREAPNLVSEKRTQVLSKLTFSSKKEIYAAVLSEIHNLFACWLRSIAC